ncbi:hypothetical protein KGM_210560 [Danaus plexippus plexippus]|uniref:Uncharacterized protein n=1 Tax=Danaus plexippus plexippus TaxID=278856 RepID=A0A212EM17_DANPL|nr:hypothetical protein KGM_210560 [Danaus plexippus plexippus]
MRRQYAEALEYCRLILQYEPHNATARGFYPLLRHKLRIQSPPPPTRTFKGTHLVDYSLTRDEPPLTPKYVIADETSSSEENTPKHGRLSDEQLKQVRLGRDFPREEKNMMRMMKFMFQSVETECSAELSASEGLGSGSGACSSLELDSSEPASPRRTDTTDPSDSADDAAAADADLRNDNSPLQVRYTPPPRLSLSPRRPTVCRVLSRASRNRRRPCRRCSVSEHTSRAPSSEGVRELTPHLQGA